MLIAPTPQAGVGDDGELLADQRGEPKIRSEPCQRRRDAIVLSDQSGQHTTDCALAGASWANHHESFLLSRIGGQAIAENLLQRGNRLGVAWPELVQEVE